MSWLGHEDAWREWRAALASARMHHAWLLTGPEGLGKAAFARQAAGELVREAGVPQPEPGAHPDILILDHLPANDEEEKKRDEGKPFQVRRNITIQQIRRMQSRLTTRPTLGSRRAVIVDPADDMEKGAVNALLKSLEEPPAGTFFLLVAHRPGRLPATIRSRCRVLRFAAIDAEEIEAVLRREAPGADAATRAAAIAAAQGSPGAALRFVSHELAAVHQAMERIVAEGDRDFAARGALAQAIGARPDRERIAATLDLARATLAARVPEWQRPRQLAAIAAHEALVALTVEAATFNYDAGLLAMEIGGLLASTVAPREAAI